MPHLTGSFAEFPDLDKIPPGDIAGWLKNKPESHVLINFFGNRLLYPQTIAQNQKDLEIDFAILREALKQRPDTVYDPKSSRILLPESYIDRFPPLARLAGAVVEALNPKGITQIYIKDNKTVKLAGTVIRPLEIEDLAKTGSSVRFEVSGVAGVLKLNSLNISQIDGTGQKIKIAEKEYIVSGGILGVIIDLRINSR